MAKCVRKKKGGVPCKGDAQEGSKYCAFHRKRLEANVTHGRTASPDVLGVPSRFTGVYQDFLNNPKPFDLRSEMAMLRTLYMELREHLDSQSVGKLDHVTDKVLDELAPKLKGSEELVQFLLTTVGQTLKATLMEEMDISWSASKDNIRELSDLLEKISRVAERMKKIQEGAKLEISLDVNLITRLLTTVVLPEVPEPDRRARIMQKASMLAISTVNDTQYAPVMNQEIPAVFAEVVDEETEGDPFEESFFAVEEEIKEEEPYDHGYSSGL